MSDRCRDAKGHKLRRSDKMKEKAISLICGDNDLTEFQKKVLTVVTEIPAGQVRTYAWVARKIGSPRSSRAVGKALSKNPYIPLVPCHRVISSDGSIGGYSGGEKRKKDMLVSEGAWPISSLPRLNADIQKKL